MNAYCTTDLVLAGVGRLHEVLGGGGWSDMAGLRPVEIEGIEDIDLSDVVEGEIPSLKRQRRHRLSHKSRWVIRTF